MKRLYIAAELLSWSLAVARAMLFSVAIATTASAQFGPCPGGVCPLPQPSYPYGWRQPSPHSPAPATIAPPAASQSPDAQPYHRAVVRVMAGNAGGSGTLIAMDAERMGIVLTCHHVIEGGGAMKVSYATGRWSTAQLIASDPRLDVAALWVRVPDGIEPIPVAEACPQKGEQIELCGYGSGWKARIGAVLGVTTHHTHEQDTLGVTATCVSGDSGGAILTRVAGKVRLAAVLWGGPLTGPGGRMTATHGTYCTPLRNWLRRVVCPRYPYCLPDGGQTPQKGPVADSPPPESDYTPDGPVATLKPCQCDHDAILASIKANTEQIAALTVLVNKVAKMPGPAGPAGPQGERGPAGPPGKDGRSATVDLDALAAEVAKRLPPVVVQTLDEYGHVTQEQQTPLGEPVRLQLVPVKGK